MRDDRCIVPGRLGSNDYRTFRLTEADALLLGEVGCGQWLYPKAVREGRVFGASAALVTAAWGVIAERHGFDASTATPHPDGGAQVLARPPARVGPVTRGGGE